MAEQLIKKHKDAMGASNLGMELVNNSLIRNPHLNVLHGKAKV
jgi:hypothetical protein